MDKEPPDPPTILPRIGYDPNSPEQRAEKHWHDNFPPSPGGFPPQPETWLDLDSRSVHLKAYVAKTGKESIAGEQAWRELAVVNAKITDLVWAAKEKLKTENPETADEAARERAWREKREAKQRAWIDKEIAEREAKAAKRRAKVAKAEEEAAAREHADDKTESELEEEAARERQLERIGGHLHEHWEREGVFQDKVVPLRREGTGSGREGRVEDREGRPEPRKVIIDLISDEDLYAKHFDPLVFLVKNMLAEGTLNILAGKPKIGKSFLALQLGRAVGAGANLWPDCPCTKVPVLYLGLEDTLRRLKHRMIGQLGAGVRPAGGVHFATLWPRIGIEGRDGIAAIEEVVERLGIRLVIIDTWARFRALSASGRGGTAYIQDYDDLAPLVDFCKRTGVAILLIHHTKKGESANIFDMISGSVGLQGAVDCEMVLTGDQIKNLAGGSRAVLSGAARDFDGFELELEFEPVPCLWKYVGKAAVVRAKGEQEGALEAMREYGKPITPSGLAKETGKKPSAAKMLLKRMLDAKLVVRGEKAGTYVVSE